MIKGVYWSYLIFFGLMVVCVSNTQAQRVPLGQEKLVRQLDQQLSGETAKRNLEFITRLHRVRGSKDFHAAIDFIAGKLTEYKLTNLEIISIPTDGKTMYGTQKSRPAYNVDFAELWDMEKIQGEWKQKIKIADWAAMPIVLAEDSEDGDVTADLVDIGTGTNADDYKNKDVKGKLVLTSSQPNLVVPMAIEKYGAAGIISYAQNQVTGWWKENENLIRWGHLATFAKTKTFAFMVSLKQASDFRQRLQGGEAVHLHAKVKAGQSPGNYEIVTAVIEGSDPVLKNEEIVFSCHLDHQRPGANDNASGCVTILEIARTLNKLIIEGDLAKPKRTLRFIWSPEIEGTTALLNFRPAIAEKAKYNIHLDMVGGGPKTKAIFHVSRSAQSIPSFIYDIGMEFGEFVTKSSAAFASGEKNSYPMLSQEGGKEALHTVMGEFHMGSDFEVYSEGSFRVPAIYLHDWPDRYIHTNYDVPANIDPTKLKRSAFIAGASGYFLASMGDKDVLNVVTAMKRRVAERMSGMLQFCEGLTPEERENTRYYFWLNEEQAFNTLSKQALINNDVAKDYSTFLSGLKAAIGAGAKQVSSFKSASVIYTRNSQVKGPMTVFGYDYFIDHYGTEKTLPALLSYEGIRGSGSEYAYEALNLVNGKHFVSDIRNILSAEFGPVSIEMLSEYLDALKGIGAIK